ncbi:hypothetical protein CK203_074095 [Vitis vinifera]|uniref:Uncharacterized protein n=1 Tax=Vitis vinifera TaxID=29760 RepID=A0A438E7T6_VITVI|nr:hypothetical protein CK203_074095 [Vitis vinifera]
MLWFALCVATNSSAWLSTSVLVTNMRNFPLSRGTVAGILKGYGGLSAAVYTEIYTTTLHKSSSELLMFLALGVPLICFTMMYFIRPCTPASGEDSAQHGHFLFTQAASVVLGSYLLTTTILNDIFSLSAPISYTFLAAMVLLLMAPLAIPIKMTLNPTNRSKSGMLNQPVGSSESMLQGEENADKTEPLLTPSSSTASLGSFHKNDIYFAGVGSGVTVLNNLAQIGIAQGVHNTTMLLCLFSFCNFLGRLGGGAVSEHFLRSKTIPRTIWMTCTQVIMVITYLLFASALDGTLYAATALLGSAMVFNFLSWSRLSLSFLA